MSTGHFLVSSIDEDPIVLEPEPSHHAIRVLRLRAGDEVTATDGRGRLVRGRIADPNPRRLAVDVRERVDVPRTTPAVTIAFALTKGSKPELVVEKLTELGVHRIVPWSSGRSVVVWDAAKRRANGDRFRAVAVSALEQSRRAWLPEVLDPLPGLDALVEVVARDRLLVAHVGADGGRIDSSLEPTTVVVGPEGGFEDAEIGRFTAAGGSFVRLSDGVLRAETAAIAAAVLALAPGEPPA